MSQRAVIDALIDRESLRAAVLRLRSARALLPTLLDAAPAEAELELDARGFFDPRAAIALGRPGLWLATDLVRRALPRIRVVPSALHERWDAVVEVNREHPEAPWLVGALVAEMSEAQKRLAARTLIGVERRFGAHGWEVIAEAVRGAPLDAFVRARRPA